MLKNLICQGGHGTGKTENLDVHFSREGNQGICLKYSKNVLFTGNLPPTQGKFRESIGNFISVGMWPPCLRIALMLAAKSVDIV